jgi:hypothetical protein
MSISIGKLHTADFGEWADVLNKCERANNWRRQQKDQPKSTDGTYTATLEQLGSQIESVQDFWRYNNNTPVDQIKMRESIYLFKQGFQPVWEDRRNINGGSWTFRVPKVNGPDFWTRVQLMAIGEKLQSCLDVGKHYDSLFE